MSNLHIPAFPTGSPVSSTYMHQLSHVQPSYYTYPPNELQHQQQHVPQHTDTQLNNTGTMLYQLSQQQQQPYALPVQYPHVSTIQQHNINTQQPNNNTVLPAKRNRSKQVYDSSTLIPDGTQSTTDSTKKTKTSPKQSYNRKEKSLSLLCDKFLSQFSHTPVLNNAGEIDESNPLNQINLDNRAAELGVERRRVYDIVNILESINMVGKRGKNLYIWYGTVYLNHALQKLYDDVENDAVNIVDGVKLKSVAHMLLPAFIESKMKDSSFSALTKNAFDYLKSNAGTRPQRQHFGANNHTNKEHSLGTLSQLFVQLFFSTPLRILSLEDAAICIMESIHLQPNLDRESAQSSFKSKVRRLYDIANVLASAQLIEKVHVVNTRKSAFRWKGAGVFNLQSEVDQSYAVVDDPKTSGTPDRLNKDVKKRKLSTELGTNTTMHTVTDAVNTVNNNNTTLIPSFPDANTAVASTDVKYDMNTPIKTRLSTATQPTQYNTADSIKIESKQDIASTKEQVPVRTAYYPSDIPNIHTKHIQHTIDTLTHLSKHNSVQSTEKTLEPCQSTDEYDLYRQNGNLLSGHSLLTHFNVACKAWLTYADIAKHEIEMGRL